MANRNWRVELEDGTHTIQLRQNALTGFGSITVDGDDAAKIRPMMGKGSTTIPFQIGRHSYAINMRTNGFTYTHDLVANGRLAGTDRIAQVHAPQLPLWMWAFFAANLAIAVPATSGGNIAAAAVDGAIGAGALSICAAVSRDAMRPANQRIGICTVVTLGAIVLFLAWVIVRRQLLGM